MFAWSGRWSRGAPAVITAQRGPVSAAFGVGLYNRLMKNPKPAANAANAANSASPEDAEHAVSTSSAEAGADSHATHAHPGTHGQGHAHAESPEAALLLAEEYCRERGEKLTPIRRKVLELLLNSGRATKAYSLLDEMRQIHPGSAPPTVYRALDFLLSAGLVHRIESINAFGLPRPDAVPARHPRGLSAMRQRDRTASAEIAPGADRADRRRRLPRRQRRNRAEGIVFRVSGRRSSAGRGESGSNGARRR